MSLQPKHIYVTLCTLFLVYSFSIYLQPYFKGSVADKTDIAAGRIVWQKNNCQSCHQLYGLGGYLGPDLTNEMSIIFNMKWPHLRKLRSHADVLARRHQASPLSTDQSMRRHIRKVHIVP